jgi:prophage DNA circulation protein
MSGGFSSLTQAQQDAVFNAPTGSTLTFADSPSAGVGFGDLLNLASNLKLGPWAWGLQPASFRGVRFAVRQSKIKRGRRVVVHEYPFRDDVYVEDLGRATRVVSFSGFLIGDDVFAQRDKMVKAAETAGTGVVVHPSLGRINATLIEFSAGERFDLGRVVEIDFSFIQGAPSTANPASSLATALAAGIAVVQTVLATASDYENAILGAIGGLNAGLTFVSNIFATVNGIISGFLTLATSAIGDSGAAASAVLGLPGNLGRYGVGTNVAVQPATATVATVLAAVTVARAGVVTASNAVSAVVDPMLMPAAVQALTEAVRAVAQDPASQLRILTNLAGYTPVTPPSSTAPVGMAIATMQAATTQLLCAAALISMANAIATYQPSSYDDAIAVLRSITILLDAAILAAADAGSTASYLALRALRAAIINDLLMRAATVPRLQTVTNRVPLPSLTLAYRLYADATRCDQLVAQANPISPLFMPTTFKALSS